MFKKISRMILTVMICIVLSSGICAVSMAADYDQEPIDGGTTNLTDYRAPKEFTSTEIVGFNASFCIFTRWKTYDEDDFFHFTIVEDEDGTLMASEEILGITCPADEGLLSSLQEIIVQNDLAAMNGIYEVTAGLPPEYSEGGLTVYYASGEILSFTTDNNPYALWAEEVYDVFAEWFAEKGYDSLYPPKEDSLVTLLKFELVENEIDIRYSDVNVTADMAIEGETHLLGLQVYDVETFEYLAEEYLLIPDEYYEKITEILAGYDLIRNYDFSRYDHDSGLFDMHDLGYYGMGGKTPADGEEDSEDRYLELHIQYESGRRVNIDTAKESEIEGLRALINELLEYHDSLFFPVDAVPEEEQFSLIINEPFDPAYSYVRCDFYLGDTPFGYFLGCPDEGDMFTHFDFTPDLFTGIEGNFDISDFRAEISLGYNDHSGVEALMQAMMGKVGRIESLATLQFAPEYGVQYEYSIIQTDDGYSLQKR